MDEQRFVQLLQELVVPDSARVKSATSELNKTYYTSPQSVCIRISTFGGCQAYEDPLTALQNAKLSGAHTLFVLQSMLALVLSAFYGYPS